MRLAALSIECHVPVFNRCISKFYTSKQRDKHYFPKTLSASNKMKEGSEIS